MKYQLTFALVACLTSTAFAAFQAPLPEFKNEKQLAEWRAEKASEATSKGYAAEETAFYTGKPYLASSRGYLFKYRSYDPENAHWNSGDPSGFPDGTNTYSYINNNPIFACDYAGLSKILMKNRWEVTLTNYFNKSYSEVVGYSAAGGAAAPAALAYITTNPAGWAIGLAVGAGVTAGALYVNGQGMSEAGNKARTEYPMWSGSVSGGHKIDEPRSISKPDDFEVRNYVTDYNVDSHFGSDAFKYSVTISYDHYVLE